MRNNRVNLRFSDDEIKDLTDKADGQKITTFCHDLITQKSIKVKKKIKTKYKNIPPELLKELNGIGNNLNQIVRLANSANKSTALEIAVLLSSVELIHEDLAELVEVLKNDSNI